VTDIPHRRRICIDITEEEYKIFSKYVPHNSRQALFRPLIEEICVKIQKNPQSFISKIITKQLQLWADKEEKDGDYKERI